MWGSRCVVPYKMFLNFRNFPHGRPKASGLEEFDDVTGDDLALVLL